MRAAALPRWRKRLDAIDPKSWPIEEQNDYKLVKAEMNGLELLERVRHKWPHVRVYLATAYDSPSYTQRAADLGAHGYFTKPLDFSALRQIMFTS